MTATRSRRKIIYKEEQQMEEDISEPVYVDIEQLDILKLFTLPSGVWYHPCIAILGGRGSGKSHKVRSLCHDMKDHFGTIYRFSPTADTPNENGELVYDGLFAKSFCWSEGSNKDLMKIIEFQTDLTQGLQLEGIEPKDKRCLILLDDMSSERGLTHGAGLKKLFSNARNLLITIIMTAQHYAHLPKDARKNCDCMIVNDEEDEDVLKVLKKEKFTQFSVEGMRQAITEFCKNWGSLCWVARHIVPKSRTNPFNNIFTFTAKKNMPAFKMNCRIPDIIDKLFLIGKEALQLLQEARMNKVIQERLGAQTGDAPPIAMDDDTSDDDDDDDDEDIIPARAKASDDEKIKSAASDSDRGEGQGLATRRMTRSVARGKNGAYVFRKQ